MSKYNIYFAEVFQIAHRSQFANDLLDDILNKLNFESIRVTAFASCQMSSIKSGKPSGMPT